MLKIGIDLDNCADYGHDFFKIFTNAMKDVSEIYILTNREISYSSKQETEAELNELGISYHHLVLTGKKAEYVLAKNISIFFEDTDEYFQHLPESVLVFKIREPGNFDFDESKWIYADTTGIDIERKRKS